MPHSRENTVHFPILFVFFLWWIFSSSLLPNWHQITRVCKYRFMSNQSCHLAAPPPNPHVTRSILVSLLNCTIFSHVRVWWSSLSQHLPRVLFVFILQLYLLPSDDFANSLNSIKLVSLALIIEFSFTDKMSCFIFLLERFVSCFSLGSPAARAESAGPLA